VPAGSLAPWSYDSAPAPGRPSEESVFRSWAPPYDIIGGGGTASTEEELHEVLDDDDDDEGEEEELAATDLNWEALFQLEFPPLSLRCDCHMIGRCCCPGSTDLSF
jgi:hypothetical protein